MKTELESTIINLYHLARTALAGGATVPTRYDRMIYVKNELKRTYPHLLGTLKAKEIWFLIEDLIS